MSPGCLTVDIVTKHLLFDDDDARVGHGTKINEVSHRRPGIQTIDEMQEPKSCPDGYKES